MMSKSLFVSGALALAALSAPAYAGNSSDTTVPQPKVEGEGQNTIVCRRFEAIGTRLSSKKVCRTKGEWDAEAAVNRQNLERGQTQRSKSD